MALYFFFDYFNLQDWFHFHLWNSFPGWFTLFILDWSQVDCGDKAIQNFKGLNLKESKYKTIHFLCLLVRNLIFTPPLHDSFCLSFLNLNTANCPLAPGSSWWFRKSAAIKNAALSVYSKISAAEFLTVCVHSTCVWVNPEGGHGAVSVH